MNLFCILFTGSNDVSREDASLGGDKEFRFPSSIDDFVDEEIIETEAASSEKGLSHGEESIPEERMSPIPTKAGQSEITATLPPEVSSMIAPIVGVTEEVAILLSGAIAETTAVEMLTSMASSSAHFGPNPFLPPPTEATTNTVAPILQRRRLSDTVPTPGSSEYLDRLTRIHTETFNKTLGVLIPMVLEKGY